MNEKYTDQDYIDFIQSVIKDKREHDFTTDGGIMGAPNKPPKSAIHLKSGWISFYTRNNITRIFYEGYDSWGSNDFTIQDGKLVRDEFDFYDFPQIFKEQFAPEFQDWLKNQ